MDFNLITLITLAAALVLGVFIGVGLGRRSSKANEYYDRIRKEADELRERAERAEAQLRTLTKNK